MKGKALAILSGILRFSSYVCVYVMGSLITENPAGHEGRASSVWWFLGAVVLGCAASATREIVLIDKWEEEGRHRK